VLAAGQALISANQEQGRQAGTPGPLETAGGKVLSGNLAHTATPCFLLRSPGEPSPSARPAVTPALEPPQL